MNKRKIKGYIVIAMDDEMKLNDMIIAWSNDGYELYGNPFLNKDKDLIEVCQAMVKYDNG